MEVDTRKVNFSTIGVSEGTRMTKISVHFQAGMDAYERGDYHTAMKEWRPLANQGYPLAQATLGLMYAEGEGVRRITKKRFAGIGSRQSRIMRRASSAWGPCISQAMACRKITS